MFNKTEESELTAMLQQKLAEATLAQKTISAEEVVEMFRDYLAKRYSTPTPGVGKNVGVHTFGEAIRRAPEPPMK